MRRGSLTFILYSLSLIDNVRSGIRLRLLDSAEGNDASGQIYEASVRALRTPRNTLYLSCERPKGGGNM